MVPAPAPAPKAARPRKPAVERDPWPTPVTDPVRLTEEAALGPRVPISAPRILDAPPIPAAAVRVGHTPTPVMLLPAIERIAATVKEAPP